jgi:hypothetical protein
MDHLDVRALRVGDLGAVERPPRLLAVVADRDRYEEVAASDERSLPPLDAEEDLASVRSFSVRNEV